MENSRKTEIQTIEWLLNDPELKQNINLLSSSLFKAIELNSDELLEVLLKKGANPNHITRVKISFYIDDRMLPLEAAFKMGYLNAVDSLLKYGAKPNLRSYQHLPLVYYASFSNDVNLLKKAQDLFPS